MLHMLLPSFHHPKSSQDRRLGVAGAAVARAGAAGRAGGAPKMMGFPWFPQRCVGLIRSKHHHQNLVDFLECIHKILNMDVYMVDLMSKEWGGLFRFFFPAEMIGSCDTQTKNIQEPFLEYDHHSLLNGSQDSNIQALVCSPETWGSGHRFCWGPVESGQSEPR